MATGFVWHERYMWWQSSAGGSGVMPHSPTIEPGRMVETPEAKRRFRNQLEASGLLKQLVQLEPRAATLDEVQAVHTNQYIHRIKSLSEDNGGEVGMHAYLGKGDFDIALLSAGGAIVAADAVINGQVNNAYALLRPSGHHACPDKGMGLCILNNAAIAGRYLMDNYGLSRIAYIDWDVHHGNGTQEAFYKDPRALTISIHQENWLPPGSGHIEERGEGPGLGYNINVPLPPGSGVGAYEAVFQRIVIPALERFNPEFIFVPSGFDAGALDPLGRMLMHSDGYRSLTNQLMNFAEQVCDGRIVMIQEGGYCEATTPFYGLAVMETLADIRTHIADPNMPMVENMGGQELQAGQDQRIKKIEPLLEAIR